jgi:hypothetical protein
VAFPNQYEEVLDVCNATVAFPLEYGNRCHSKPVIDDIPTGGFKHCSGEDASPMPRSVMPSVFCPRILP